MFHRPHDQRIERALGALNAKMLRELRCLFGGGTAIGLRYGEYRESVDIDFAVSGADGYRRLRQALTGAKGLGPSFGGAWCYRCHQRVSTLTPLDMTTSKLLANPDRWADDGTFSRDLIDLAMMASTLDLLRRAVAKAEGPYGDAVLRDLAKAIEQIKNRGAGSIGACKQWECRCPEPCCGGRSGRYNVFCPETPEAGRDGCLRKQGKSDVFLSNMADSL